VTQTCTAQGLAGAARARAVVVILCGVVLSVLDGSLVNLALPGITREFAAPPSHGIWVVTTYQVAVLSMMLPLAYLGDVLGHRRVYVCGAALFTCAACLCMVAPSLPMLAASRALQGIGTAGILSVNSALVRHIYSSDHLGRGIALNSAFVAVASVAGPSLAALVLSFTSWHWLFGMTVPLGVLLVVFGGKALPASRGATPQQPAVGWTDGILNVCVFALFFLAANLIGSGFGAGTRPTVLISGLVTALSAAALGTLYLHRQRRYAMPLFPVDLLSKGTFALSVWISVMSYIAQSLAIVALPFLLIDVWHFPAAQAGLILTAWPVGAIVGTTTSGPLMRAYGNDAMGALGIGVMGTGILLLAMAGPAPEATDLGWRLGVCGWGFGLFQSPNIHMIVMQAPLRRAGAASGMVGSARLSGQAGGAALLAAICGTSALGRPGWILALWVSVAFAAVAVFLSVRRLRLGR
jgi:DHA2 family multidrug resistance protein-like MFS transporter